MSVLEKMGIRTVGVELEGVLLKQGRHPISVKALLGKRGGGEFSGGKLIYDIGESQAEVISTCPAERREMERHISALEASLRGFLGRGFSIAFNDLFFRRDAVVVLNDDERYRELERALTEEAVRRVSIRNGLHFHVPLLDMGVDQALSFWMCACNYITFASATIEKWYVETGLSEPERNAWTYELMNSMGRGPLLDRIFVSQKEFTEYLLSLSRLLGVEGCPAGQAPSSIEEIFTKGFSCAWLPVRLSPSRSDGKPLTLEFRVFPTVPPRMVPFVFRKWVIPALEYAYCATAE